MSEELNLQTRPTRRNRKWIILTSILVILLLLSEVIVPQILLSLSKQTPPTNSNNLKELTYFLDEYDQSRERFLSYESKLKTKWPMTKRHSFPIDEQEGLYIDILTTSANQSRENLVMLTTGLHGIEGYAGSAMLDAFMDQFLDQIDEEQTGIILVHAINPWGMKHKRRYNENNVDLNRNFINDWDSFDPNSNKNYLKLEHFLQNENRIGNITRHEIGFYSGLIYNLIKESSETIESALLTGQYTHPNGVYFGGSQDEASTTYMKQFFRDIMQLGYHNIAHIDLHTGYGPREQMSIFSSATETMNQTEAEKVFNYPLVLTPETEAFYLTSGDMTEYLYQLQRNEFPNQQLYSTTFEFGTLGDSTLASIQSLKYTIDENRLYWNGRSSKITEQIVKNRYLSLFYPSEEEWRLKAVEDFKQAFIGVMTYRGIIK